MRQFDQSIIESENAILISIPVDNNSLIAAFSYTPHNANMTFFKLKYPFLRSIL